MPLPAGPLLRFVFGGSVDGSNIWNVGVWWTKPTPADGAIDYNALAADVLSKFNSDFWASTTSPWKANCSTGTTLQTCKVYGYDAGLLTGEGSATQTAVAGTSNSCSPGYTAAVATLQTASFGRSHRGRIYLPHTTAVNNLQQLGVVQAHADNLKTFLVRNTFAGLPSAPILESQIVSRTHGTSDNITKVRIDTKPDTQRGRIGKLIPTGTFTSVVRTS